MEHHSKPLGTYKIFLIGFMGSGKSTISKYLKEHYGMEKIEMDKRIEEQEGMRIADIFVCMANRISGIWKQSF